MPIEYRGRDNDPYVVMLRCPVCGADLFGRKTSTHVATHEPEEFGLSPLGQRRSPAGGEDRCLA